jgi:hypothetical protein
MTVNEEVLFFGRANCDLSSKALNHLVGLGFKVFSVLSKGRGESIPTDATGWSGGYIFCFRSMFILPKSLLDRAKKGAINFHPGPPEYPGSGCLNYALYENSRLFGVTAHLMTEKVDDGEIIKCRRFPIHVTDTVNSLLERSHIKLLDLFFDVTSGVALHGRDYIDASLNQSKGEIWSGIKRKIKNIDDLSIIDKNIAEDDLRRLIRATYTQDFPPKIILHGYEFFLQSDKKT